MKFNYYSLASMKRNSPVVVPINQYFNSRDNAIKSFDQQSLPLNIQRKIGTYFKSSDRSFVGSSQAFKFIQPLHFGRKPKNLTGDNTKSYKQTDEVLAKDSVNVDEQWRNNQKWLVWILSIWFLVAISLLISCVAMV